MSSMERKYALNRVYVTMNVFDEASYVWCQIQAALSRVLCPAIRTASLGHKMAITISSSDQACSENIIPRSSNE